MGYPRRTAVPTGERRPCLACEEGQGDPGARPRPGAARVREHVAVARGAGGGGAARPGDHEGGEEGGGAAHGAVLCPSASGRQSRVPERRNVVTWIRW